MNFTPLPPLLSSSTSPWIQPEGEDCLQGAVGALPGEGPASPQRHCGQDVHEDCTHLCQTRYTMSHTQTLYWKYTVSHPACCVAIGCMLDGGSIYPLLITSCIIECPLCALLCRSSSSDSTGWSRLPQCTRYSHEEAPVKSQACVRMAYIQV